MRKRCIIFALCALLGGCKQEEQKELKVRPVQDIDREAYVIKKDEAASKGEQELPLKEKADVENVTFPDPSPLMRENQARALRGMRQHQMRMRISRGGAINDFKEPEKAQWRLQDPDYQQWENSPLEDKSTYPVDRARILTEDMRISAVLEDSVNSQIPGRFIAVIDRDVYSPTLKNILLPAYTKVVCRYESLEKVGSSRLLVKCYRAIRPDGVSIMLTDASASDQMGRAGLIGEVDLRVWQRYGAGFIMASFSALSQGGAALTSNQTVAGAANVLSQHMGQVTAKALDQYIDMAPILTIPAGSRVHIIPGADIHLRAPSQEKENAKKQGENGQKMGERQTL